MSSITIQVPDELSERFAQLGDRLPEWLDLSLRQPALPAHIYRYILDFLASNSTPEQLSNVEPTTESTSRLRTLMASEPEAALTLVPQHGIDEYERATH